MSEMQLNDHQAQENDSVDKLDTKSNLDSSRSMDSNNSTQIPSSEDSEPQKEPCLICCRRMVQPIRLPCLHLFCFLCVKGIAMTTCRAKPRCPLCRKSIPMDVYMRPFLYTKNESAHKDASEDSEKFVWFYSTKDKTAWWRYDARLSDDIEKAFKAGEKTLDLLICGLKFKINFEEMTQCEICDGSVSRSIKRDLFSCKSIGTSGVLDEAHFSSSDLVCPEDLSEDEDSDESSFDSSISSIQGIYPFSEDPIFGGILAERMDTEGSDHAETEDQQNNCNS